MPPEQSASPAQATLPNQPLADAWLWRAIANKYHGYIWPTGILVVDENANEQQFYPFSEITQFKISAALGGGMRFRHDGKRVNLLFYNPVWGG